MKNFRNLLCCLVITITSTVSYCQNVSVDPLSGSANVGIPLGSISAYDLGESVSLFHNGAALRADESPGTAGMGWNISVGGSITREVRGLPDDFTKSGDLRKGWLHSPMTPMIQSFVPAENNDLNDCSSEAANWTFINSLGFVSDPEPDIYFFNAPGISGKFIHDASGVIRLIPFQDLVIEPKTNGFTIKTNTGTVYEFDVEETVSRQAINPDPSKQIRHFKTSYELYKEPIEFASAWKLSTVKSNVTGATIQYTYVAGPEELGSHSLSGVELEGEKKFKLINPEYTNKTDELFFYKEITKPKLISSITLKSYSIQFTWANSLIQKIVFGETETEDSKTFNFEYKSVENAFDSDNIFAREVPFLKSVLQENNCQQFPPYIFSYEGVNLNTKKMPMAWTNGWGKDIYGFYNGESQWHSKAPTPEAIPPIYFYANQSGAMRYRTSPLPGETEPPLLPGGNMRVSKEHVATGALKSIYFPSGGQTTIQYEVNKYWDAAANQALIGPGIRVKSIVTSGGDLDGRKVGDTVLTGTGHSIRKSYVYTNSLNDTTTSGRIMYPPVFTVVKSDTIFRAQTDLGPGSFVLYHHVKEILHGQGYRTYEFDLPLMFPDNNSTFNRIARVGEGCTQGYLQNSSYAFPYAPVTDISHSRGMLKRLSEYSESGQLTQQRRLFYAEPLPMISIKALRFEATLDGYNTNFFYGLYDIPVEQSKVLTTEKIKVIGDESPSDSVVTTIAYLYDIRNRLIEQSSTDQDGAITRQFYKYAYDYKITSPSQSDEQVKAIAALNANGRNGELIETYQDYTSPFGTTRTTGGSLTMFKEYGSYVWPFEVKQLTTTSTFTPSGVSTAPNQVFTFDAAYMTTNTFYFDNGFKVAEKNLSNLVQSTLMASNVSVPVATFQHCLVENVVFDGFDYTTPRSFSMNNTTYDAGWTGNRSLVLEPSRTTTKSFVKGDESYRISAWVKSATLGSLTIRIVGGNSINLNYPGTNRWTYVEGFIAVDGLGSSLTLEVTTSQTILFDDFLAIPKIARASLQTVKPFTGLTSASDDTGGSTLIEYDPLGRKQSVLDKNRNLVERTQYGFQEIPTMELSAAFTTNTTRFLAGEEIIFTALGYGCIPDASYSWDFYDYAENHWSDIGNSITTSFSTHGEHKVRLTVSSPSHETVSYEEIICVYPPEGTGVTIHVINNQSPTTDPLKIFQCNLNNDRDKTFVPVLTRANPHSTFVPTVKWFITDMNGVWTGLMTLGSSEAGYAIDAQGTLTITAPLYDFQVKCVVSSPGFSEDGSTSCNDPRQLANATIGIDYVDNSPCQ